MEYLIYVLNPIDIEKLNNTNMIFWIGSILIISFVVYKQYLQNKENNERDFERAQVEKAYLEAQKRKDNLRIKVDNSIINTYGKDILKKVDEGTIWIGMPMHLLVMAKGNADNKKEQIYKNKIIEKWYYGQHINRLGNYNYSLEITTEDYVVVGWKDLRLN